MSVDLPAVLASASSLAAMTPSDLTSLSTTTTIPSGIQNSSSNNESLSVQHLVERFIRIPPYSTRIYHLENSIVIAHRRIRQQLSILGSEAPELPSSANDDSNPNITIEHVLHPSSRSSTFIEDFYNLQ